MKREPWALDAEKATGKKWSELDRFDQIQWMKRYPRGRWLLATPVAIRAFGRDRFDDIHEK